MDKVFDVPPEMWAAFVSCQETAAKARNEARELWEKIADHHGIVAPTMKVLEEGKVTGELVPDPQFMAEKQALTIVDVIRSQVEPELQEKILELVKVAPVRPLGKQVEMLYEGFTLEDAYSAEFDDAPESAEEETLMGNVLEVMEGDDE